MKPLRLIFAMFLACVQFVPGMAQDRMRVTVHVLNKTDDKKPLVGESVSIYSYSSLREGEEAQARWNDYVRKYNAGDYSASFESGIIMSGPDNPDIYGECEVIVSAKGSILLVYMNDSSVKPVLVAVRGRSDLTVLFDVGGLVIDDAKVFASMGSRPPEVDDIVIDGDSLKCGGTLYLPSEHRGKTDARLGYQSYMVRHENPLDTIYFTPIIIDGNDYRLTQIRRKGFDRSRDTLLMLSDQTKHLTRDLEKVEWHKTIPLESEDERVYVKGRIWLEDYNHVYYRNDSLLWADTWRAKRPLRFLQYNLRFFDLPDIEEYRQRPKLERMNDFKQMSLHFLVGKAQLDPADTTGARDISQLKETLRNIQQDPDYTMRRVIISGVASPEGRYASNVALAAQRLQYMKHELDAVISLPPDDFDLDSKVASWLDVADLMYADSLKEEAATIRNIVEKNSSMDAQNAAILKLPYYRDKALRAKFFEPYFERLRTVKVEYTYDVQRVLTDEEILYRYRNDEDFRSGKREFTLHEYDRLLRMLDKPEDIEPLCRRAMEVARKQTAQGFLPWPIPANRLAASYISRDTVDVNLLEPFIDINLGRSDFSLRDMSGIVQTRNPSAIIANQVVMLLKSGSFKERANRLAKMLPHYADPDYESLYAITRCLIGHYKLRNEEGQRVRDAVIRSSTRNAFVINLAMKQFLSAEESLDSLDKKDALTHYFYSQFYCERNNYENRTQKWSDVSIWDSAMAEEMLEHLTLSFQKDSSLISIAERDGYIFEDLYKAAKAAYDKNPFPPEEKDEAEFVIPDSWEWFDETKSYFDHKTGKEYIKENGQWIDIYGEPYVREEEQ